MKRKSSIIRLSLIGAAIIIGFVFAFCPFPAGFNDYRGFANNIKLGLDLKGGVYAVYEASDNDSGESFSAAMNSTVAGLNGIVPGAVVQKEGGNKIRISVPGATSPQEIQDVLVALGEKAELEFMMDDPDFGETVLTGKKHVESAVARSNGGTHYVEIVFTKDGGKLFEQVTGDNPGQTMHIVIVRGDKRDVVASPTLPEKPITGGRATITASGPEEAQRLAQQISAGLSSLTLMQLEMATVPAIFGEKAILFSLIAGIVGLVLIIAVMILLYRLLGVASGMTTLAFTVVYLFILAVFPWVQLTLSGIVGLLLSITMAIAANIIICENIKEHYRAGKSILSATHYGFRKSIKTIADVYAVNFIVGLALLIFGAVFGISFVVGFASILLIGIFLAAFSSLLLMPRLVTHFTRINDFDPKLFKLRRGKEFEHLDADRNDSVTEVELMERAQRMGARRRKEEAKEQP
ncbi:MAG: hypothetical protein FWE84_03065 [Firmicutes bacterium]|nr:hypothetical protein [Bacillota bacterium]